MRRKQTIKVRAGDGIMIPLPTDLAIDTTVAMLTPDTVVEVKLNSYTRKRLTAGDFVEVKAKEPVKEGWGAVPADAAERPPSANLRKGKE